MTNDIFKPVRDHLVVACTHLAGNSERTDVLSDRLRAVERQMDWRGDPHTALRDLPAIIEELKELKAVRPAGATGTEKLAQNHETVLLPGVGEAIVQLESAVALLEAKG